MSRLQSTLGQLALPCIAVEREPQRQLLFKAKHTNSCAWCTAPALSDSGRHWLPYGNRRQWGWTMHWFKQNEQQGWLVTERAAPAVHSLMSKLLVQRGMDPMQSEIVLKTRGPEQACSVARVLSITQMRAASQDARSAPLAVRAWTCLAGTGLEPEHENGDLGFGGMGCSRRQQGRHPQQPLSLLWKRDGHGGCPRCGEQPWLSPGQALACLALPWF